MVNTPKRKTCSVEQAQEPLKRNEYHANEMCEGSNHGPVMPAIRSPVNHVKSRNECMNKARCILIRERFTISSDPA
jgi:hypothetical protein